MTPEDIQPFLPLYPLCASFAILFSLFATGVFLGLAVYDFWENIDLSKTKKIMLTIAMFLLPEIGVICWVFLFGRSRKRIYRILAFCSSVLYLALQIGMFIVGHGIGGMNHGFTNLMMMQCLWSPFIVIGGGISYFVFKSLFSNESSTEE